MTNATSKTSKTSKTAKTVADIDAVSSSLLAQAVAIGKGNEEKEYALVLAFAREFTAGKLSVRGLRATIQAALDTPGVGFGFICTSMADNIEIIASLVASDNQTARTLDLGQLNTLATRMVKTAKPENAKTSKAEQARLNAFALKTANAKLKDGAKRAAALVALQTKTDKAFKLLAENKKTGNKSGKVETLTLTVESVRAMQKLIQSAGVKDSQFSDEMLAALTDLGITIQVWVGEDALANA